jgi:hypothetical protein
MPYLSGYSIYTPGHYVQCSPTLFQPVSFTIGVSFSLLAFQFSARLFQLKEKNIKVFELDF